MHQHLNYRGPRRRENESLWKTFQESIVENFPIMEKEILNQVQKAQRIPYRINPRRNTSRHILIKLTKTKLPCCKGEETSNIQWKPHTLNS